MFKFINKKTSERAAKLEKIKYVVDKLHIKGHVGTECHATVHPNLFPELVNINTVICEQVNFFLGGFKHMLKHMNRARYHFFLFIIFNMWNEVKIEGRSELTEIYKYESKYYKFYKER